VFRFPEHRFSFGRSATSWVATSTLPFALVLCVAIDVNVQPELDAHLILDYYGTHKTELIRRCLAKRQRFHLHSWMNSPRARERERESCSSIL
jgi:hypothetical protein